MTENDPDPGLDAEPCQTCVSPDDDTLCFANDTTDRDSPQPAEWGINIYSSALWVCDDCCDELNEQYPYELYAFGHLIDLVDDESELPEGVTPPGETAAQ